MDVKRWSCSAITMLAACAVLAFAVFAAPAQAQLPAPPASSASPLRVGGYTGITLTRSAADARIQIAESNIAAILSGSLTTRLSYLAEVDAVSSSRENFAGRQDDRQLEIARLYAEITHSDPLRLRVGRFLTPIGQWNEIHAEPLTWTAVRPVTTYRSFAKYSTGAMLAGQGVLAGRDAGYAVWAAPDLRLHEVDEEELEFTGAVGARIAVEALPGVSFGLSGGLLRERRPESEFEDDSLGVPEPPEDSLDDDSDDEDERIARRLAAMDVTARFRGFEFRAEAVWLGHGVTRPAERSAFAQLAAPLVRERLFLLARAEQLSPIAGRTYATRMLGLHWRAPRRFVVKIEHHETGSAPPVVARGWFASVSTYF